MTDRNHFPRPVSHVGAMAPYTLADLGAPPGKRLISLAQNESLRPPSPMVVEAVSQAMSDASLYPDPDWRELREAISRVHGVDPASVLCGAGSMELIASLGRAYLGPGRSLVTTQYAYAFIQTVAQFTECQLIAVPERDFHVDVDKILSAVRPDTSIVFIANPGNPTGTRIANTEIRRLHAALPQTVLLIVDEAYGEFSDDAEAPLFDLARSGNCVILRTFSKAYGLAGMRVGWGMFPGVVATQVRKVLNPNNVSMASQAAATAAMLDQVYMRETCRLTAGIRDRFADRLADLAIKTVPSSTNFILIDAGSAAAASAMMAALKAEGVLLRGMAGYGLPHCVRATIGLQDEMDLAVRLMEDWKQNADNGRVKA